MGITKGRLRKRERGREDWKEGKGNLGGERKRAFSLFVPERERDREREGGRKR